MAIRKKMKNTVIVIGLLFILFLACLFPLLNLPIFDCIAYLLSWFTGQERAEACSPSLTKPDSLETVKLILLIIGGLMAVYTLILADERQEKFSEQVETSQEQVKQFSKQVDNAQAQLFNDRLGRGVELLANDSVTLRVAGVRILDDLAKTSNHGQIGLIIKILYDHLKNRGDIRYTENEAGENVPEDRGHRKTRQSVELALKTILTLANTDNISREDIIFEELDLRGLDISGVACELPRVIFTRVLADKIKLSGSILNKALLGGAFTKADFSGAILNDAKFDVGAKLTEAKFPQAELNRAVFYDCDLRGAVFHWAHLRQAGIYLSEITEGERHLGSSRIDFFNADLRGVNFSESVLKECNFKDANLEGADFTHANFYFMVRTVEIGWAKNNMKKTDIRGATGLTQQQFDTIIFEEGVRPINFPKGINLPADRAYVLEGRRRRFVQSDKPWSGKLVEDVLAYPPLN